MLNIVHFKNFHNLFQSNPVQTRKLYGIFFAPIQINYYICLTSDVQITKLLSDA